MAGEQFEVHPSALTGLAGTFESEAVTLHQQTGAFQQGAFEVGQAFGVLGVCDGAMSRYATLLAGTVNALGQLGQVLDSDGTRLRANAALYSGADQNVADNVRSIGS